MIDPAQNIKDALKKYPSGWENLTESWVLDETNESFVEAQAVVGSVTQEDFRAGVIFVDTGNYYQPEHAKPIANFIAACNATAIRVLLERLEAAEKDSERAKKCALKYLDYLGLKEVEKALAQDMLNPEMVGPELAAMEQEK